MPRYLFKAFATRSPPPDVQGEDLPDDEAAWREATLYAGQLLKEGGGRLRPGQEWALEVADEAGKAIFNIHISTKNTSGEGASVRLVAAGFGPNLLMSRRGSWHCRRHTHDR